MISDTMDTRAYVQDYSDGDVIIIRQMRRPANETAFRAHYIELTPEQAAFIGAKLLRFAAQEKGE